MFLLSLKPIRKFLPESEHKTYMHRETRILTFCADSVGNMLALVLEQSLLYGKTIPLFVDLWRVSLATWN